MTTLEIHGNDKTMNLDQVLLNSIQSSLYFKQLGSVRTFSDVVDEIYNNVEYLAPYIPNTKSPSTAYCILYKLFLMKLRDNEMVTLLEHQDSPYIRAIGFLYLRYCHPPTKLLEWFDSYFEDFEYVKISPKSSEITMQRFMVILLTEPKFNNESLLPRLPVKTQKEIDEKVEKFSNKGPRDDYKRDNRDNSRYNSRDGNRDNYKNDNRDGNRDYRGGYQDNRYNYRDNRNNYKNDNRESRDSYRENRGGYIDKRDYRDNYSDPRSMERRGYRDLDYSQNSDREYNNRGSGGYNYRDSYSRKRSRSRSRSRSPPPPPPPNDNDDEPKKSNESESLKKLRTLYGAESNTVSLDDSSFNYKD
ncbi:putative U4/U6.U5 small nuclear ribonucleoparticle-associated protein [Tieghemostelium lacteum]|uniref:Pre-mRNA-splicing factor 38 n=1 Tax=Tieghemostelium lacteum TaxID=361077 RepID=A0A151Z6Y5_TIELA|nr:putative U4/U6.U5 small nuclear ribonucleoparticle-associated protein [Tieghemostelium lacteum]|eukprot:KYQ89726.1 putative U4/U6.U5 small nuclear ribonucleoparticle-associated protein [Tieghemostelium lacteum]